jgi:hypothetical protein
MELPLSLNFQESAVSQRTLENDAQKAKMFHAPAKIVVLERFHFPRMATTPGLFVLPHFRTETGGAPLLGAL